jgi:hypothetical protein
VCEQRGVGFHCKQHSACKPDHPQSKTEGERPRIRETLPNHTPCQEQPALLSVTTLEWQVGKNLRAFDFHGIQGTRVQPKSLENCRGHLHGFDGTKDRIPFK